MIKEIQIIEKNDSWFLIAIEDKDDVIINYSSLKKYWNYSDPIEIENYNISIFNQYVILTATAFSGQDGIVAIYDANTLEWIHINKGDYAIKACIVEDVVVTLCSISNYATKPYFLIEMSKFNTFEMKDDLPFIKLKIGDSEKTGEILVENSLDMTYQNGVLKIQINDYDETIELEKLKEAFKQK